MPLYLYQWARSRKNSPKKIYAPEVKNFLGGGGRCPGPSIDTNGQEVSKIFQRQFFHALRKKLEVRHHLRRIADVTA